MRILKVYGWAGCPRGARGQVRCIVAAHSLAEAAGISRNSLYFMRGWSTETGNLGEIAAALAKPKTVLYRRLDCYGDGTPWTPEAPEES